MPGWSLVRREYPTAIGPVDLLCRDAAGAVVAVEIKRRGEIDGVEQFTRYLELLNRDPLLAPVKGVFAAQEIKPQARVLAADRGIDCVTVDYAVLKGTDDPTRASSEGLVTGRRTRQGGSVTQPRTIDEVLAALRTVVDDAARTGDRAGLFAAVYRQVTAAVARGLADGRFDDADRLNRFDAVFAGRYLTALAAWRDGRDPGRSWRLAFRAARGPRPRARPARRPRHQRAHQPRPGGGGRADEPRGPDRRN